MRWILPILAFVLLSGQPQPSEARRVFSHSFEGEINTTYGAKVFKYFKPRRGQRLDRAVVAKMASDFDAEYRAVGSKKALAKIGWKDLSDRGKATYLNLLFRKVSAETLRPEFFARYRNDAFSISKREWEALPKKAQLEHVAYENLNQTGRKLFKRILHDAFPLYATKKVPSSFERKLFWESPTTYELRHKSKSQNSRFVHDAVLWMKGKISERVRPHRHVSWKPNLEAITQRRKELLSFVQRVDMLMFSERLEKRSIGALVGSYGKNFKPYQASKLAAIDRSMVERTYSLFLGSKMHNLGLRTYRDGTVGLEVRAVTDAEQLDYYTKTIHQAVKRGRIGKLRYDERPLELKPVGAALAEHVAVRVEPGRRSKGDVAAWIDGRVKGIGLDERLAYPLLDWEHQAFVTPATRRLVVKARRAFVRDAADLFALHARFELGSEDLRKQLMVAVWRFAEACKLSADLRRSIEAPLRGRKTSGPSLVADE